MRIHRLEPIMEYNKNYRSRSTHHTGSNVTTASSRPKLNRLPHQLLRVDNKEIHNVYKPTRYITMAEQRIQSGRSKCIHSSQEDSRETGKRHRLRIDVSWRLGTRIWSRSRGLWRIVGSSCMMHLVFINGQGCLSEEHKHWDTVKGFAFTKKGIRS